MVTSGYVDAGQPSICGYAFDMQIDPAVIDINTTANLPPPFPPPPPKASVIGQKAGYIMYDYNQMMGNPHPPSLLPGSANLYTGYWDDITEMFMPLPANGFGDYMTSTYPALVDIDVTSKNGTRGCLIDLIDFEWLDGTNTWHAVDVVIDGYYGTPPGSIYMSEVTGTYNPTLDPTGTTWHELYPNYCDIWVVETWSDNTDGDLSASDQIIFENASEWTWPVHVDAVTTTIHYTFKATPPVEEHADAEPMEPNLLGQIMNNPVGSYWHEIYPTYCKMFKITGWTDNGETGFDPSDQFTILYEDPWPAPPFPPPGAGPYEVHLDNMTTDIVLTPKGEPKPPPIPEFPFGVALMIAIAPAIPILYLWRSRKKVVAK